MAIYFTIAGTNHHYQQTGTRKRKSFFEDLAASCQRTGIETGYYLYSPDSAGLTTVYSEELKFNGFPQI